jgi:hypothetical protein
MKVASLRQKCGEAGFMRELFPGASADLVHPFPPRRMAARVRLHQTFQPFATEVDSAEIDRTGEYPGAWSTPRRWALRRKILKYGGSASRTSSTAA